MNTALALLAIYLYVVGMVAAGVVCEQNLPDFRFLKRTGILFAWPLVFTVAFIASFFERGEGEE